MSMTAGGWQAMSDAAFETVSERFSIDGVAVRHVAIYRSLLRGLARSAETTVADRGLQPPPT